MGGPTKALTRVVDSFELGRLGQYLVREGHDLDIWVLVQVICGLAARVQG